MFNVIGDSVKAFSQMHIQSWCNLGDALFVGEGNLSFAKSLVNMPFSRVDNIIATTFEKEKDITQETEQNGISLKHKGVIIRHHVDATKLEQYFEAQSFDTIIFQFPNVGSRDTKYGHTPNHVLIRNFLRSAKPFLKPHGKILISTVDNPHYHGAFQFDEAAKFAGYKTLKTYPFDPFLFSGYAHTNTNDKDSALDEHRKFLTWVFQIEK